MLTRGCVLDMIVGQFLAIHISHQSIVGFWVFVSCMGSRCVILFTLDTNASLRLSFEKSLQPWSAWLRIAVLNGLPMECHGKSRSQVTVVFVGLWMIPSEICYNLLLNIVIEIVDLPFKDCDFPYLVMLVYKRVNNRNWHVDAFNMLQWQS